MTKNTPIVLSEKLSVFVDGQVRAGRFGSAHEVVEAALHQMADRESTLDALRAALIEGEQSGPSAPLDFETYIAEKRAATAA